MASKHEPDSLVSKELPIHKDDTGASQPAEAEYSCYSKKQKRLIILLAASVAFLSPLSSNIYLPALDTIADVLHVTSTDVNLTVTTYLILQAVAPSFIAAFSDTGGRRPAYLISFVLFIAANIGLALQTNYVALLILRGVQSAGSSGTVPLLSGVIADLATSAERGSYLAYGSVSNILGPTLAPVIGGLLSEFLGWRSTFWFLVIFTGPLFVIVVLFLSETARQIVGNGLYKPPRALHHSITSSRQRRAWREEGLVGDPDEQARLLARFKFKFPNPLESLVILFTKGPGSLMFFNGLMIGIHYLVLTSIPYIFQRTYGFSNLKIALMYLPYGVGSVISSLTTGKMTDWNFARHAKRRGFPLIKTKQFDLTHFPIEQARLEVAVPFVYFCSAMLVVYGWTLHIGPISLAAPVVLTFCIGWSIVAIYQVTAVLITDMYPEAPVVATSANNIVRCLFGAGATAAVIPMIQRIGLGWTFTIAALVAAMCSLICFLLMRKGCAWRAELLQKAAKKKLKNQHEAQVDKTHSDEKVAETG